MILGRPSAGRDLRLRLQPERIFAKNFGGFPTKKVGIQNLLTTKVIQQKISGVPTKKVGKVICYYKGFFAEYLGG